MKKIRYLSYIVLALAMLSCSLEGVTVNPTGSTGAHSAAVTEEKFTDISVTIMVPDYEVTADSRAIAPQTNDIVLQYKSGSSWKNAGSAVLLSAAVKERVPDTPTNFPGKKMTVTFSGLPLKSYEVGSLQILLRDASQNTITYGTNTQPVKTEYGKSSSAVFYAVPKNASSMSGSLKLNQMKFAKVTLTGGKTYTAKVTSSSGSEYPDLVLFTESGEFYKYIPVTGDSSGQTTVSITADKSHTFYLGIWAKSKAISSYAVQINDSDLVFVEDFENDANQTTNRWQTVACSTPPVYTSLTPKTGYTYYGEDVVHGGERAYMLNGEAKRSSAWAFKVTLEQDGMMSFYYRCHLKNIQNKDKTSFTITIDGNAPTYIVNNTTLNWKKKEIRLKPGTHTVTFKTNNTSDIQFDQGFNGAVIDDITIRYVPAIPDFTEDFESGTLDSSFWTDFLFNNIYITTHNIGDYWYDKFGVHSGVLNDPHDGKVLCISYGSITLQGINLSTAGALTFWYKADTTSRQSFIVDIDNKENIVPNVYTKRRWQKITYPLSAGSHIIKFVSTSSDNIYIDDVSIATDTVESVEITPRGKQQTYIGGHTIAYKANALRIDGSVISGKTASWSVNGGGTISSSGVFTPSSAGTFTVTATIGNKQATATVVVHNSKTSDPMTFGNNTFTGPKNDTATGYNMTNPYGFTFDTSVMPSKKSFDADGYFIIKGTQNFDKGIDSHRLYVSAKYQDTEKIREEWFIGADSNGNINERIWLRHGPGTYSFTICDGTITRRSNTTEYNNENRGVPKISGWAPFPNHDKDYVILTITNTNPLSADYAMWMLPSQEVGFDNYRIQNVAEDIIGSLPANASDADKLKAIYDWEADYFYYDYTSTSGEDGFHNGIYRRSQFAIDVLDGECAVCEGYADLFAALSRYLGFRTKVMNSDIAYHAWNQVWYANDWLCTDVCWGDSETHISGIDKYANQDKDPGSGCYGFFLLNHGKHTMYSEHSNDLNNIGELKDEFGQISRGDSDDIINDTVVWNR